MAVQTQIQTRRGTAASWTSTNPTLAAGEIGFETDTGKFKIGNGSTAWASLAYSAGATAVTYLFNATASQTTFSGADANGLTLAYTVGAEQVYLNGVLQVRGSDYTATNGTSIVLASGALVSDVLNVIAYSAMTVTDTYTQAQADAKFYQLAFNGAAGKNNVINGGFDIWQRGTSIAPASATNYTADRWAGYLTTGRTVSRQATGDTTNLPNIQYCARVQRDSGNTSTTVMQFIQSIETANSIPYAGKSVTLSFYARKGANYSSASDALTVLLVTGTGTDQSLVTGFTGSTQIVSQTATLTTTWQRFTYTATVGATATQLGIQYQYTPVGTAGAADYFEVTGVQLELGSIATPFARATGTIQGELAACQRYYYRATAVDGAYTRFGTGIASGNNNAYFMVPLPVTMRSTISAVESSTVGIYNGTNVFAATTVYLDTASRFTVDVGVGIGSASLTTGNAYQLLGNNSTSAYVGFSAEL